MRETLTAATGQAVRLACREGWWSGPTAGLARGFVQANLVILPRNYAYDFLLFCQRNPKPCPVLDVTEPGNKEPTGIAGGADVTRDLPAYYVYRRGELVEERPEIGELWRPDSVAFLIGCSFTFENALMQEGLTPRHIEQNRNVPMYRTNILCRSAGPFAGPMVVSMRPYTSEQARRASEITARFPRAHGSPVHVGDPNHLGIGDLDKPDYGDPIPIRSGEVPVFWACGVTPQAVGVAARIPELVTHKPGHMFLTDLRDSDLRENF